MLIKIDSHDSHLCMFTNTLWKGKGLDNHSSERRRRLDTEENGLNELEILHIQGNAHMCVIKALM